MKEELSRPKLHQEGGQASHESSGIFIEGRGYKEDVAAASGQLIFAESLTGAAQYERRLRRKKLAAHVVRQWKYVARERLLATRLQSVFFSPAYWHHRCFYIWQKYHEQKKIKQKALIKAQAYYRYRRQIRAFRRLIDRIRRKQMKDQIGKTIDKAYLGRGLRWLRLHAAQCIARRRRLLCLDGYAQSALAHRLMWRWKENHIAAASALLPKTQVIALTLHFWAERRRIKALSHWWAWTKHRQQQRRALQSLTKHLALRRVVRRWVGFAAAGGGKEEGEKEKDKKVIIAQGYAERIGLERVMKKWKGAKQERFFYSQGLAEAADLQRVVGGATRAVHRWRREVVEKRERRIRAKAALQYMRARRLLSVWRLLYRLLFRLRRQRIQEKMGYANIFRDHRLCARVWSGWLQHLQDRCFKAQAKEKAHVFRIHWALRRWSKWLGHHSDAIVKYQLAETSHESIWQCKGLQRWRKRIEVEKRRKERIEEAKKLWAKRTSRRVIGRFHRSLLPAVRVRDRSEGRLLSRVMWALKVNRKIRKLKQAWRDVGIRHWKDVKCHQAIQQWKAWRRRRVAQKLLIQDAEDWAIERLLRRALRHHLLPSCQRSQHQHQLLEIGQAHYLRHWVERQWRWKVAKRALSRAGWSRVEEERQRRCLGKAFKRWRSRADAMAVRKAVLNEKSNRAQQAASKVRLRGAMSFWLEWSRHRAIKRLGTVRARARYQRTLLMQIWTGWAAVAKEQGDMKRMLRSAIRLRAKMLKRKGLQGLIRRVDEKRYMLINLRKALWTWKAMTERRGWKIWQCYQNVRRKKKAKAREALVWHRKALLKEGCLRWLETADGLRSQRVGLATREQTRRTEKAWAAAARAAAKWRRFVRKRREMRLAERGGPARSLALSSSSMGPAATTTSWQPKGRGGLWASGEGRFLSLSQPPALSTTLAYTRSSSSSRLHLSPPRLIPSALNHLPGGSSSHFATCSNKEAHLPSTSSIPQEGKASFSVSFSSSAPSQSMTRPQPRLRDRPPPRRPVELLLESRGVKVPDWILSRMNEKEEEMREETTTQEEDIRRRKEEQQKGQIGKSSRMDGPKIASTAPFSHPHPHPPKSASSSAITRPRPRWAQGADEQEEDEEQQVYMAATAFKMNGRHHSNSRAQSGGGGVRGGGGGGEEDDVSRHGVSVDNSGLVRVEDLLEDDEEKDMKEGEEGEEEDLETLEARLRGWMLEKERFKVAKAEVMRLEAKMNSSGGGGAVKAASSRRMKEVRVILQGYGEWKKRTLPKIRALSQVIHRLRFETSSASTAATLS